ncbi:MAG: DUF2577 domain-containing protein [Lachnospira sp.]|nr:DUF2577 domain-containing protein [Lachnospira sp.]
MPDAVELMKTIKQAAVEAVDAQKPAEVCFGKVTSVSPLKIVVEQKMILGEAQLILSRNVTDFKTEVTINIITESSLEMDAPISESVQLNLAHTHQITGRKEITIHNSLVVGDLVILIRQQKGQKYFVIDKVG